MSNTIVVEQVIQKLAALGERIPAPKALLGFDGYVDYIQKAVQTSTGEESRHFQTLSDFGKHVALAAGKSAQVELRTIVTKFGGNAPIMAHALAQLGTPNYCIGTMGYPNLHDTFHQLHERCTILSVGEPAITNALEFGDGKLILSETSTFKDLDLGHVLRILGENVLDHALDESKLIAMVDWVNLPKCSCLWEQIYERLKSRGVRGRLFFFDLCDPSKKTRQEIQEILTIIGRFRQLGKTILGLNENEAGKIYLALSDDEPGGDTNSVGTEGAGEGRPHRLTEISQFIFDRTNIDILVVHPVDCSLITTNSGVTRLSGKRVDQPKILTGGGDNFNAGFCFGLLNDLSPEESAMLGMATSGAYVCNGCSPAVPEVIEFLKTY